MSGLVIWTVEVQQSDGGEYRGPWSVWSAWVDRSTAEAEMAEAADQGYVTRLRQARDDD